MSENNLSLAQRVVRDSVLIRAMNNQNIEECGETHRDTDSDDDELNTNCSDKCDSVSKICFSLTNFHTLLHPLIEQDLMYCLNVEAKLKRVAEVQVTNRCKQKIYIEQKSRLEIKYGLVTKTPT